MERLMNTSITKHFKYFISFFYMSSTEVIACAVGLWLIFIILLFMVVMMFNINSIMNDLNKRHMELFHQRVRTQMLLRENMNSTHEENSQFMPPQPLIYGDQKNKF